MSSTLHCEWDAVLSDQANLGIKRESHVDIWDNGWGCVGERLTATDKSSAEAGCTTQTGSCSEDLIQCSIASKYPIPRKVMTLLASEHCASIASHVCRIAVLLILCATAAEPRLARRNQALGNSIVARRCRNSERMEILLHEDIKGHTY